MLLSLQNRVMMLFGGKAEGVYVNISGIQEEDDINNFFYPIFWDNYIIIK
jgi:hypothetical protein